jgi:hypothetical protein
MSIISRHKLPESFRKYFWDCNFNELSLKQYPKFVLERILNYGTLEDIKWIKKQVDENYFHQIATQSRRLDNKTLNYWRIIYQDAD